MIVKSQKVNKYFCLLDAENFSDIDPNAFTYEYLRTQDLNSSNYKNLNLKENHILDDNSINKKKTTEKSYLNLLSSNILEANHIEKSPRAKNGTIREFVNRNISSSKESNLNITPSSNLLNNEVAEINRKNLKLEISQINLKKRKLNR
jgi:hypothetical protein